MKFIDDGTVAVSINLKSSLVPAAGNKPQPLNYNERTCQVLPKEENLLQYYLEDAEKFTQDNKMRINSKKTKIMKFNKSRKHDFPPKLHFSDKMELEVVQDMKLVGVIVSQDLKWQKNTDFICNKASQKLWILRRLKKFKLSIYQLVDVYIKEVRSILEYAVPVWQSGISKKQSKQIEKIQRVAFRIILEESYTNYEVACTLLSLEPLYLRRVQLCLKFGKKELKRSSSLFTKAPRHIHTRRAQKLVKEYRCRTKRFQNSSIPYLSRLLNNQ